MNEDYVSVFIRHTQREHFGKRPADLSRRKVHHGENLPVNKFRSFIVGRKFGQRLFDAKLRAKVDSQDICRVPSLGKWPDIRYPDHVNYFTPVTLERLIRQSGLGMKRFTWRDRLATSDNMWLVAARS